MEDIVQLKLLFVAALLVMSGIVTLLAYAIARLGEWFRARAGRARRPTVTRRPVKSIPVRGTR
jgi:hypothetical protein